MFHQRQHQQPTNGGTGSKAPLLVLGAAALMIQGLLVLPTTANAKSTINLSSNNNNNNDASGAIANSGNSKVSFDLSVHHNLQTIASLSTGGSAPAGAGPQLWGTTSAAATMVSHSNNATITPANLQQEQEQDQQQKDAFEGTSSALYRKIRLEETSDVSASVDSTTPMAATAKDVGLVEEMEGIQSGEVEPAVDDDLAQEVTSVEKESVSRNTDVDASDTKKKDDSKDVTTVAVVEEESLSIFLNPVSLSTLSTAANDDKKKKSKKITSTEVGDEKKADDYDDDDDDDENVQNDDDKTTAADETESMTETEAEADAGTPRVGDQVVLDKDGNLVKDITLENEAEKKATDASSVEKHEDGPLATVETNADTTTDNKQPKPPNLEEEEEEEEEEKKEGPGDKKDDKGKKGEEDNAKDNKEAEKTEKDETTTAVLDGGKKKGHRDQAFARLREQLVKQQQQQQRLSVERTDTTEAPAELDQTAGTTPVVEDGTTTLARAADFVPPEDMRAVMNAKAEKDKTENKKTQSPLTPQQIADTEHQGANAFFELFAADVFPEVKLVGNNQLQDLDFEQRLNKQKKDKKAKAAKKKQQQDKKDKKKEANKNGGKKQQQDEHQNEKRALFAAAPEMTEKERVHAVLENIFGKDGAAKIEEDETDDSTNVEITAQGFDKGTFATTDADAEDDAAVDADADGEDAKLIDFDQDLDDEPIGILGAGKKNHHKKKHHRKHQREAAAEGDPTTVFTTGDDAKDTKDNKLTPPADSPMSMPSAGGPPERTAPGPSAAQPQPQQRQGLKPASGAASPASPPAGAPPAGTKGGPVTPSKGETGTAGFGTVPMFGPAQLDLGNSAASLVTSKSSIALALVIGVAWIIL